MDVAPLEYAHLDAATRVLAEACPFDRAAEVAEEKLFGKAPLPAPLGPVLSSAPQVAPPLTNMPCLYSAAFGAFDGTTLVGVAAASSKWLRVLAVVPGARRRGVGSALLDACVAHTRMMRETRMRVLDQPGNYLAPGIDTRNTETIAWLEKRGFEHSGDPRCNVLVAVRDNPRVTIERAEAAAAAARARGYVIERATRHDLSLIAAVRESFGGAWPWEVTSALEHDAVHVALKDDEYCAFAAHDGNNRGLGWFGPTGTWPEHRGQGLGEALLLACLVDVARDHERCEVAWIGPRPFYDKIAGIVDERTFVAMAKELDGA